MEKTLDGVERNDEVELASLNHLSPSEKHQFFTDVAQIKDDLRCRATSNASSSNLFRKRAATYSPTAPENAPAVLTFTDITVTAKNKNRTVLLNKCSGSITGGCWAIMGASGKI